jgi:alpha-mannosidase
MVGPSGDLVLENPSESLTHRICIDPVTHAVDIEIVAFNQPKPDRGLNAGLQTAFAFDIANPTLFADQPLSVTEVTGTSSGLKKYPTGDWMTSPQVFEDVEGALTAMSLIDTCEEGRGVLVIHDGSQQWFLDEGGLRNLLNMYDPWDEEHFRADFIAHYRIASHAAIANADRKRAALDFLRPFESATKGKDGGDLPREFETLSLPDEGVVVSALHRETEHDGLRFEAYAGKEFEYPSVLRLVEFNGNEAHIELKIAGEVGKAVRTNLLGEACGECDLHSGRLESIVRLDVKPYEITSLYLDWVPGRKQIRDLDAHRDVWATVHRVEQ